MARINHRNLVVLNILLLDIHRACSKEELIELAIYHAPCIVGINYTVWHNRLEGTGLDANSVFAQPSHKKGIVDRLESINHNLQTHPVIVGLGIEETMKIPEDIVTTCDFGSLREIRNTAIYHEAYRHIEIENHAVVEFYDHKGEGVMICFNHNKEFSSEQKLMVQMIRDNLELAYMKLTKSADYEHALVTLGCIDYISDLTKREREVLPLIVKAKSNAEMAIILGISIRTVEKHVSSLFEKTGFENRKVLITCLSNSCL